MVISGGFPVAFWTTRNSFVTTSMTCPVCSTRSPFLLESSEPKRQPGELRFWDDPERSVVGVGGFTCTTAMSSDGTREEKYNLISWVVYVISWNNIHKLLGVQIELKLELNIFHLGSDVFPANFNASSYWVTSGWQLRLAPICYSTQWLTVKNKGWFALLAMKGSKGGLNNTCLRHT